MKSTLSWPCAPCTRHSVSIRDRCFASEFDHAHEVSLDRVTVHLVPSLPMARKTATSRAPRAAHPPHPSPQSSLPARREAALEIYDTTLRDGAQAEDVSFSVEDKVRVAQKLDELGVHFIEGVNSSGSSKLFRSSMPPSLRSGRRGKPAIPSARTPIFRRSLPPTRRRSHCSGKRGHCMSPMRWAFRWPPILN